jgi:hypothetical protein
VGLTAANAGFLMAGGLLYFAGRRLLFRVQPAPQRRRELVGASLVCVLTVAGFALAHLGMNASWTGDARFSSAEWLQPALGLSAALLVAHVLLRLQRSSADEFVLPIAAFLCALGLINVDVWEKRDANAYVSTVALPATGRVGDPRRIVEPICNAVGVGIAWRLGGGAAAEGESRDASRHTQQERVRGAGHR